MRGVSRERRVTTKILAVSLSAALFGGAVAAFAQQPDQSQQNQQPSSGQGPQPQEQPGSEIYIPKKAPPPKPKEEKVQKINPNQVYTIRTQSNLVNVNVLVTDRSGDPITNLAKSNFRIYDNGVEQPITNFSTAAAPLTVTLLVEFSNKWWGYLYLALQDAYEFLNFMRPHDWVAVVSFGMKPHILQDFTHDPQAVRSALDSLRIPGFSETNLYDALAFTEDRMKNIQGRKAIIVICTGIDTFSKITYPQMLKIAKTSDTPIYPVSILQWVYMRNGVSDMTAALARNQLSFIARYSGGQAYFPAFTGAVPDIYRQIGDTLRHEYSLGFIPTHTAQSGKYHKLEVKLVDPAGNPLRIVNKKGKQVKYKIVTRQGYYAPGA